MTVDIYEALRESHEVQRGLCTRLLRARPTDGHARRDALYALRTELEAERRRIRIEVQTAFDAYDRRVQAVRVLQEQALAGLDENETLTARSFEVGQLGLAELLLIRREILDTRFQYLDTLLEAALARIELHASAAVLR